MLRRGRPRLRGPAVNPAADRPALPLKTVSAAALRRMLDDGGEIAVLDVREEGVFARDGHLLLAANAPFGQLELRVPRLVPRPNVRLVVCDGADGLAQAAAARLTQLGYDRVMVLDGGTPAWAAAGHRLYTGVYVPSKAFGEYVLHEDHTPEVSVAELAAWQRAARDMLILDSRPLDEFRRNSIPGAIDCPGAELVYRVHDLLPSAATTVVVNCGGRTRSIIGAQTLINAGLPNRVVALKDGTQGWHLAGFALEHGRSRQAPLPTAAGRAWAQRAARQVAQRYGVRNIDAAALARLQADTGRTVYVLDVRSPEEFAAGHRPGAWSVPGGQLIQATDLYLGVRHAAVVLIDDCGVRATTTAAWLLQMGWRDVFVCAQALDDVVPEHGPAPAAVPGLDRAPVDVVSAQELRALLVQGRAQVADFDNSLRYAEGHIPGASHVLRSRLRQNLAALPAAERLVFTSADGVLARLAAMDALECVAVPVAVLRGGTAAWTAAGFALERGPTRTPGTDEDLRYRALDRQDNVESAIREYLRWEVDLLSAVDADADFGFRRFA